MAIERDNLEMVHLLITEGANVNHDSPHLGLPLNYAAGVFRGEMVVARLLDAGADIEGQSAASGNYRHAGTPLHFAARWGFPTTVAMLLDHGADIHARNRRDAYTPLHAAQHGTSVSTEERLEVIRLLLEHGADINSRDIEGHTPLYWATNAYETDEYKIDPSEPVPQFLIEHGATL